MANNSTVTKALQVSEEAAPPVHIPVMVGNELFVLTQQDVRRVEDTRYISYSRLTPNMFAGPTYTANAPAGLLGMLHPLISNCQQMGPINFQPAAQQTEQPQEIMADITKQLKWSKSCKSSPALPITYSVGTTTNGLPQTDVHATKSIHCSCQTIPETTSRGCNTEQLKPPLQKHCVSFCEDVCLENLAPEQTSPETTSRGCNTEQMKPPLQKHCVSFCEDVCLENLAPEQPCETQRTDSVVRP